MTRHVHTPLPRPTHVRDGMSSADLIIAEADLIIAETMDALLNGRTVQCACGRTGYIRRHNKGIRWHYPTPEQKAKEEENA